MKNLFLYFRALLKVPPVFYVCGGTMLSYYGLNFFYKAGKTGAFLLFAAVALSVLAFAIVAIMQSKSRDRLSGLIIIACIIFGILFGVKERCAAITDVKVMTGLDPAAITGIEGRLLDDPRTTKTGKGMGTLLLSRSFGKKGLEASARGKVLVFFPEGAIPRLKEFGRGADIFVEGTFSSDFESGTVNTKMYRAKGTHVVRPAPVIDRWRTACRAALIDVFSTPRAAHFGGFSLALLLGITDNIDRQMQAQFLQAGCSHILALSGMHLVIICALLAFFLKKPLGLKLSSAISAVFIIFYVYIVGGGASLVRAEIMYLTGLAAIFFNLHKSAALLLSLSFLIQIGLDPSSGDSVSFVLSYAALAGILSLGDWFAYIFRGSVPEKIGTPIAVSLGAFASTVVFSIGFFGELRFIGIIAGLILAPLTDIFMQASIAYLFLSAVFPPLTVPLSFLLNIHYDVLQKIAAFASKAPVIIAPASFTTITLSILLPLAVAFLYFYVKKKRSVTVVW
ncbi:MAG: hypothetical protein Ta2G_07630 [Termitinemataceae bacterium]|nr:MAG: hypothetical protein Ta2G_07630 [Termitinemataceae bacterium]